MEMKITGWGKGWRKWWGAARPKTLPASVSPVIAATAVVTLSHSIDWVLVVLCAVVALALQVGVNYANDYSDGIRGTDSKRVGPVRLTATGLATPSRVKRAAGIALGVACAAGLAVAFISQPPLRAVGLIAVGALSVIAALLYTGGPRPYGYWGLGELMVFVFFGLVATLGTFYVQANTLTLEALLIAVAMGCWAVAMLITNNLRDIETDEAARKLTLVVRIGDKASRWFYVAMAIVPVVLLLAFAIAINAPVGLGVVFVPLAYAVAREVVRVLKGVSGSALIAVLASTGRLQLLYVFVVVVTCSVA